jgi:phosphatidylserine decarboxylase
MPEHTPEHIHESATTPPLRSHALPGLDAEATPVLGVGLGLTGLTLGLRPRFAALPLALTALTALMYRNPERTTPDVPGALFAASDGTILTIDEVYEHRYLHTDAIRISSILSPFDVPVSRSPANGTVRYCEHVAGEHRSIQHPDAAEINTRTYIGIETTWGPLLIVQVAGPLARRLHTRVQPGDHVAAGERIGTARFGSRTDLLVQRDSIRPLVAAGHRLTAGVSHVARLVPL